MEPFADAPAWAGALEASSLGILMRSSFLLYPLANIGHIFGLVLFVGAIVVLDLRLLSRRWPALPADALSRALTPVILVGLGMMLVSGTLLFSADARPLAVNPAIQVKAVLIVLGLANALAFRLLWRAQLANWDRSAPPLARAQVAASLLGWLATAASGRMIGYL